MCKNSTTLYEVLGTIIPSIEKGRGVKL